MLCGFAAAGVSHRPENHDKATTSPERPLLPTSGRPPRPASFPDEIGLRTSHSASQLLGRSASAPPSICSQAGSQAKPVIHRAAWSVDSSLKCQEGPPLLPQDIPDRAACATDNASLPEEPGAGTSPGPYPPLQSTPDQLAPSGSREELRAGDEVPGSPMEAAKGSLSGTQKPTEDKGAALDSEFLEPSQRSSLCSDPQTPDRSAQDPFLGDQSSKPTGQGQPCPTKASPSPPEGEQSFAFSGEGEGPASALSTCPGEAFVEVMEEEVLATASQLEPSLPLGGSPMEVNWSQENPAFSIDLLPEEDQMLPGSTTFGMTDAASAAVSLSTVSSEGQLSSLAEELCPSLTSALKELHWLLIESCKGDSREEHSCQPASAPEEPVASQAADEEDPSGGCLFPDSGDGKVSPSGCLLEEPVESLAVVREEPSDLKGPVIQSPSAAPSQLQVRELPEISPCLFSSQGSGHRVLEQDQPLSISLPKAEDASWSAGSSAPAGPGMLGVQGSPAGSSEPLPVSAAVPGPPALAPEAFPAADIDRIVGSGFTSQEAGEALAHAGGNADLALLILLAKNIVVPR